MPPPATLPQVMSAAASGGASSPGGKRAKLDAPRLQQAASSAAMLMDVEAGEDAREGAGGAARKKSGRKGKKGELAGGGDLTQIMLKSLLSLYQGQRMLQSAVTDVFLLTSECPEVAAMSMQGQSYAEAVKGKKDHGLGPAFLYVFGGLLEALLGRGEAVGLKNASVLSTLKAEWVQLEVEARADLIRVCTISRCYDPQLRKLVMVWGDGAGAPEAKKAVYGALAQVGAERRQGRAPASRLKALQL